MGIFDFFKSKSKSSKIENPEKSPMKPDPRNGFGLNVRDFVVKTQSAKVISVTISPDFYELFPEAKEPVKASNKLEIRTSTAEVVFWGRPVELSYNPDLITGNLEEFVDKINDQLNWLIKNKHAVDEVVIRDLLPLKNDSWLDENEAALNGERFLEAICPSSVDFDKETGMNLYYNDGGTFFGHEIVVEISSKREVKEASIVG